MEKQLSEKLPRVEVVDALRGFAVMAILLVHSLEHFIFPVYPVDQPAWLNILNDGVFNVTFTLLAGKSYAIFALLFGFTFYIQSANQQRKGKDFGYRFLWRLLLLVAFATLNAAFFPAGDVLLLFSVVGIVLFVVRKWSDCACGGQTKGGVVGAQRNFLLVNKVVGNLVGWIIEKPFSHISYRGVFFRMENIHVAKNNEMMLSARYRYIEHIVFSITLHKKRMVFGRVDC